MAANSNFYIRNSSSRFKLRERISQLSCWKILRNGDRNSKGLGNVDVYALSFKLFLRTNTWSLDCVIGETSPKVCGGAAVRRPKIPTDGCTPSVCLGRGCCTQVQSGRVAGGVHGQISTSSPGSLPISPSFRVPLLLDRDEACKRDRFDYIFSPFLPSRDRGT